MWVYVSPLSLGVRITTGEAKHGELLTAFTLGGGVGVVDVVGKHSLRYGGAEAGFLDSQTSSCCWGTIQRSRE